MQKTKTLALGLKEGRHDLREPRARRALAVADGYVVCIGTRWSLQPRACTHPLEHRLRAPALLRAPHQHARCPRRLPVPSPCSAVLRFLTGTLSAMRCMIFLRCMMAMSGMCMCTRLGCVPAPHSRLSLSCRKPGAQAAGIAAACRGLGALPLPAGEESVARATARTAAWAAACSAEANERALAASCPTGRGTLVWSSAAPAGDGCLESGSTSGSRTLSAALEPSASELSHHHLPEPRAGLRGPLGWP